VDLVCKNTVDEKIIKSLRDKSSIARTITGDEWREWI
jgi:SNF2 family DNA or RNA helicase